MLTPWKKSYDQPRQHIKKQRHYFGNNDQSSQGNGFPSSHVWMWELDYRKAEHQRIDAFELWLEKTLWESLEAEEIKLVHPKGNQSWMFTGRTDVEAETPILWPPDVKSWLIWKYHDAGKNWRWLEKGMAEDEMFGWHHLLNGHEFE